MLEEILATAIGIGLPIVFYHLLGRWSLWFKERPITRLVAALILMIAAAFGIAGLIYG